MIRAAAINKLPKKTFLVLWELVMVRLLIPFSIPSVFSVYTLVTHGLSSAALPEVTTDYNMPTKGTRRKQLCDRVITINMHILMGEDILQLFLILPVRFFRH